MNADLLLFRRKPEVVFSPDFLALAFGLVGSPSPHALECGPYILCRRSVPANDGLESVPFAIAELSFDLLAKPHVGWPLTFCCHQVSRLYFVRRITPRWVVSENTSSSSNWLQ